MKPYGGDAADLDSLGPPRPAASGPPCPVDRLPIRRRNRWCLRVILFGALNFLLYTVVYASIGGDAHNGYVRHDRRLDGTMHKSYVIRGHFIRSPNGQDRDVSRSMWIYSYLHSISVWVTSAAMIISMLVLARPHIIATMRHGWISGQTFIVAFGTLIVLVAGAAVFTFTWDFVAQLNG